MNLIKSQLILLGAIVGLVLGQGCDRRDFGSDSFVCACNADQCDLPGTVVAPTEPESYTSVTTSRDELRFDVQGGTYEDAPFEDGSIVHLDIEYEYQEIFGFGGAFTDATGVNIASLSEGAQDNFMKSYFGPEGHGYSMCRIPIAGCDFSVRPYSYDEEWDDVSLEHFAMAEEDHMYKFPFIKRAMEMSERELRFFGSPWSPPPWMKENGMHNGTGALLREMWQPYSDYLVKFINAYEAEGIPIWGLTPQNEPLLGFIDLAYNTCGWIAEDMRDWIAANLGPTLEANDLDRIQLMVWDFNRNDLWYPAVCLENPETNKYVDGIAVHWYEDEFIPPGVLTETAANFPDKFMLYTEACAGWYGPDQGVILGNWTRGELYANSITDAVSHRQAGWVDWNMALDMQGGPNWVYNFVDAPIIVDKENDEFFKQPTFYVLGHFSKFMEPGGHAVYSGISGNHEHLNSAAVHNPDGSYAVVVLNKDETAQSVSLETGTKKYINFEMPAKSITTVLFNNNASK